ncbi:MAG: glycosyltransferase [Sphingomonadaceae bacterium]
MEHARLQTLPGPAPAGVRDVLVMVGMPLSRKGPAYTAAMLARAMRSDALRPVIYTSANRWAGAPLDLPVVTGAPDFGTLANGVALRLAGGTLQRRIQTKLLAALRDAPVPPIVWMFGNHPLSLARELHAMGIPVVREKINCAKATGRRLIGAEHAKYGFPPFTEISERACAQEAEELRLADAVFCPSPMVTQSLLELGIPAERLLATSYGWEPERLAGTSRALEPMDDGITLAFVGQLCVRKGVHVLLEAWARANIRGRLVFAGGVDPLIRERYAEILARPDVIQLGFVKDVGAVYRSADWFIFPTLEEGGPQVTYEAAGCGVPAIVSRMGAGAFTRDGLDGHVVEPIDVDTWAAMIASLPDRRAEREAMAASALAHAADFTWEKVGARRREALLARFG